jgi:origin recognition complex subunit 5
VIITSRECITVRHLLEQTATKCWNKVREISQTSRVDDSQPRCDSVNNLSTQLEKVLRTVPKFILVFDGIDRQKEATPLLIPALARFGSIIRGLSVVFILSIPSPRLLHLPGLPHIYFPPYSKEETIKIVSLDTPHIFLKPVDEEEFDYGDEEETEDRGWLWPRYCTIVWDVMGKAAAKDVRRFRNVCHTLWRPFVQPIIDGKFGTRDFSKLAVSTRTLFQNENAISGLFTEKNQSEPIKIGHKKSTLEDLPYYAKYVLCAAYLASYNPARQDSIYFMKASEKRRRRKTAGRPPKHRKIPRNLLNPSPFPLDRLLAIVHSLLPRKLPQNAQILAQIATLMSLRLLVKQGATNSDTLDPSIRFKVNCSWEYVASIGRSVGLEVRDYLAT